MKKIRFGSPVDTDAIRVKHNITEIAKEGINDFLKVISDDSFTLKYTMNTEDIVFGLGENVGGMNKRGGIYESFCSDVYAHTSDVKSLYAAHNLIIVDGERHFAIFVDHPGKVQFDIGFTDKNQLLITAENPNFDLYIIEGENTKTIVKKFREAIGQSYVPPKWAFGFQQSRWSYPDIQSIDAITDKFLKNEIPCDSIYMDIDYMEEYKNFTIDQDKYPEFPKFVKSIKDKGFRLVPIIDAGCKIEDNYDVYEEGVDKGFFCVDKNGKPFVGAVWPGKVHFPDFLNPEARKWFGDKYQFLIDQGIEGFWNDMNEPAIFYSADGIQSAYDAVEESKGKNLGIDLFFKLKDSFEDISNKVSDYKSFYHNINGKMVNHYDVHNLYGFNMTKAASESMVDKYKGKRFLLFSRASTVGMHRYGGIWTGDNKSWWEHLLLNIKMMPSINMLGFLYSGADIGGFSSDANSELLIRWTQFGIFTPLLRNHACLGTRSQEPFSFDNETTDIMRKTIQLRYALIPYIYSEFMKAVINNESYMQPLSFEYDNEFAKRVETQVLVGDSIMLAPIYEANTIGRNIWLPEPMLLWKVGDYHQFDVEVIPKGHSYIDTALDQVPLFIRKNKILLVGNHAANVDSLDNREINILAFVDSSATYTLYEDDGVSDSYKKGKYNELFITVDRNLSNEIEVKVKISGETKIERVHFTVVDIKGTLQEGSLNL